MPTFVKTLGESVWDLPPLILHPFNERVPPTTLLENAKAALMLAGLIPDGGSDQAELTRRLLSGRYAEIRMLYFLGKDIFRWMEQCREQVARTRELAGAEVYAQSFAGLLAGSPPLNVQEKLTRWGVGDHAAIFARAIGLNAAFAVPPAMEGLTEEFPPQLPPLRRPLVLGLHGNPAASRHRAGQLPLRDLCVGRVLPDAGKPVGRVGAGHARPARPAHVPGPPRRANWRPPAIA